MKLQTAQYAALYAIAGLASHVKETGAVPLSPDVELSMEKREPGGVFEAAKTCLGFSCVQAATSKKVAVKSTEPSDLSGQSSFSDIGVTEHGVGHKNAEDQLAFLASYKGKNSKLRGKTEFWKEYEKKPYPVETTSFPLKSQQKPMSGEATLAINHNLQGFKGM